MRAQIRVKYKGEWKLLVKLSREKGSDKQLVYDRWIRAGKPEEINDDRLFGPKNEKYCYEAKVLYFNGEVVNPSDLAKKYNVARSTVLRHAAVHKWKLTSENFKIDIEASKRAIAAKKMKAMERVEANSGKMTGWWEREHLKDAGKNGFSGGKSETILPCRVVR